MLTLAAADSIVPQNEKQFTFEIKGSAKPALLWSRDKIVATITSALDKYTTLKNPDDTIVRGRLRELAVAGIEGAYQLITWVSHLSGDEKHISGSLSKILPCHDTRFQRKVALALSILKRQSLLSNSQVNRLGEIFPFLEEATLGWSQNREYIQASMHALWNELETSIETMRSWYTRLYHQYQSEEIDGQKLIDNYRSLLRQSRATLDLITDELLEAYAVGVDDAWVIRTWRLLLEAYSFFTSPEQLFPPGWQHDGKNIAENILSPGIISSYKWKVRVLKSALGIPTTYLL